MIINVTSAAGRVPGVPFSGFYDASKHALGALSESMAWELQPFGVRVVCIEPGFFATNVLKNADWGVIDPQSPYAADEAWINNFYAKSMDGASGDPAVVAAAIVGAVDDPSTALHTLVGDDAVMVVDLVDKAGTFEGWIPVGTAIVEAVAGPRPVQPAATPS